LKAPKTSGGGRTPVRHTIPLGIVIFLVEHATELLISFISIKNNMGPRTLPWRTPHLTDTTLDTTIVIPHNCAFLV